MESNTRIPSLTPISILAIAVTAPLLAAAATSYGAYKLGSKVINAVTSGLGRGRGFQVAKESVKDFVKYAESPVGRRGWEIENTLFQPVRNQPTTICGRQYSGHGLDQMQNRGIMPSVVENTIKKWSHANRKKSRNYFLL